MNLDTDPTEVIECFRKCFPYYVSEPERKIIKKYFRVRILYFWLICFVWFSHWFHKKELEVLAIPFEICMSMKKTINF